MPTPTISDWRKRLESIGKTELTDTQKRIMAGIEASKKRNAELAKDVDKRRKEYEENQANKNKVAAQANKNKVVSQADKKKSSNIPVKIRKTKSRAYTAEVDNVQADKNKIVTQANKNKVATQANKNKIKEQSKPLINKSTAPKSIDKTIKYNPENQDVHNINKHFLETYTGYQARKLRKKRRTALLIRELNKD